MLKKVLLDTPLPLFYTGPDLEADSIPCIIYLALSAKETLLIAPFNQPITFLHSYPVRTFSVDLPFHGEDLPSTEGMKRWAEAFMQEENILADFLNKLEASLHILFNHITPSKICIAGLSRGGFIASHIAARFEKIDILIAFAPLTQLKDGLEFEPIKDSPLLHSLDLKTLTPILSQKTIRVYIGNRDVRVSTDSCYTWIRSLVEEAFSSHNIKSPPIELILKPSIGYLGHGTAKETFEEGALWILKKLGLFL